jgi:RNA polymerase primary sigma factor
MRVRAVESKGRFMMITSPAYDRCRSEPAAATVRRGAGRNGLTRDEEYALAARIAAGDRTARNRLVQANLGLVVAIARRFLGRGLDFDDLVGEGNLGLIRAAEEFDPRFGARFSTYAVCWIKQAMRHALMHTASTIRLPERMVGLLMKWRRAEWALGRELGRAPKFDEVASYLGLSEAKKSLVVRAIEAGRLRPGSRDDDRPGGGLSGWVTDRHGPAGEWVEAEEERAVAWRLIGRLNDRERVILTLRFGLEGESLTLEEIGRRLGITRERVRQVENHALRKLGEGRLDPVGDSRPMIGTLSPQGAQIAR